MGSFKTLQEIIIWQMIQTIQYKQKHIKYWCIFKSQKGKWVKLEANQSVTIEFNLLNVCCGLDFSCHYRISMRTHNLQYKTPQKSCIKNISILNKPAIPWLSANKTVPTPPDNPISENNQTMRLNMKQRILD